MKNIIIWGAGNRTAVCLERKLFHGVNILAIVDSRPKGKTFAGHALVLPQEIEDYGEYDYIVVSNQFYQEIVIQLLEIRVPLEKIIITDHVKEEPFRTCFEKGKDIIPLVYNAHKDVIKQTVKTSQRDLDDGETIFSDARFKSLEYGLDYFRYRTFEFVAEEIGRNGIEGELAELGVFRGIFSAVMNHRFPERKLYLFDTFEGFDEQEAQREMEQGRCNQTFIEFHKDTSVERMLGNLPYPERAKICKGLFPASVTREAEKEKFAFVSMDVDFEESTYEGLKFFYPRLSEGGYLFAHDYNTRYLKGIRAAVERYEKDLGRKLKAVPIADRAGTLIIVK